jgi:transmembrane sensor
MSMDEWIGEKIPDDILDAAAMWIARLDSEEADRHDRQTFARWLEESPLHAQAYSELTPVWARMSTLGELRESIGSGNVVALSSARAQDVAEEPVLVSGPPWWAAAATLVLIVIGLVASGTEHAPGAFYETGVGERRQIALEDGSTIYLDTDSQVTVQYSARARHITLDKGEAVFVVAEDRDRPFEVETSFGDVRALGTEFLVSDLAGRRQVAVLKGTVEVDPVAGRSALTEFDGRALRPLVPARRTLEGGQAVTFEGETLVDEAAPARNPDWLDGVLSWRDMPLADAIAAYSRYTHLRYQLAPELQAGQLISGDVRTGEEASFEALLAAHNIAVTQRRPGWFILSAVKKS